MNKTVKIFKTLDLNVIPTEAMKGLRYKTCTEEVGGSLTKGLEQGKEVPEEWVKNRPNSCGIMRYKEVTKLVFTKKKLESFDNYRKKGGCLKELENIKDIKGIGPKTVSLLKEAGFGKMLYFFATEDATNSDIHRVSAFHSKEGINIAFHKGKWTKLDEVLVSIPCLPVEISEKPRKRPGLLDPTTGIHWHIGSKRVLQGLPEKYVPNTADINHEFGAEPLRYENKKIAGVIEDEPGFFLEGFDTPVRIKDVQYAPGTRFIDPKDLDISGYNADLHIELVRMNNTIGWKFEWSKDGDTTTADGFHWFYAGGAALKDKVLDHDVDDNLDDNQVRQILSDTWTRDSDRWNYRQQWSIECWHSPEGEEYATLVDKCEKLKAVERKTVLELIEVKKVEKEVQAFKEHNPKLAEGITFYKRYMLGNDDRIELAEEMAALSNDDQSYYSALVKMNGVVEHFITQKTMHEIAADIECAYNRVQMTLEGLTPLAQKTMWDADRFHTQWLLRMYLEGRPESTTKIRGQHHKMYAELGGGKEFVEFVKIPPQQTDVEFLKHKKPVKWVTMDGVKKYGEIEVIGLIPPPTKQAVFTETEVVRESTRNEWNVITLSAFDKIECAHKRKVKVAQHLYAMKQAK